MARLIAELGDLFAESHRLEAGIREKLAGIGFNSKVTADDGYTTILRSVGFAIRLS